MGDDQGGRLTSCFKPQTIPISKKRTSVTYHRITYLRALERIPDDHLLPLYEGEPFATAVDAKDRFQDYAFSQGFAIVIHNHEKTRQIIVLECTQHRSHTKNWRKTPLEE